DETETERSSAQSLKPSNGSEIIASREAVIDRDYLELLVFEAVELKLDAAGNLMVPVQAFLLNLFDDAALSVVKLDTATDDLGNTVFRGVLAGKEPGEVTLVLTGDDVTGHIRAGSRTFNIVPRGNGLHRITETRPVRPLKDDAVIP